MVFIRCSLQVSKKTAHRDRVPGTNAFLSNVATSIAAVLSLSTEQLKDPFSAVSSVVSLYIIVLNLEKLCEAIVFQISKLEKWYISEHSESQGCILAQIRENVF